MLNIKDYQEKIEELYLEGKTAKEISSLLGLKYHQPVYNYFKKKGWERDGKGGRITYDVNVDFFTCIDTEEKAYILGFICADGHISEDRLVITVSIKDVDILEKIKKYTADMKAQVVAKDAKLKQVGYKQYLAEK